MTDWSISTTPSFLNELLKLPRDVSKRVTRKISVIQQDPHSARGDAVRLQGNREVSRIHIDDDHRLFYTFGNAWIKLLSVCNRRDCYKKNIPDTSIPSTPPITSDEDDYWNNIQISNLPFEESSQDDFITSKQQLKDWNIPEKYWSSILSIKNEDDILNLQIPEEYICSLIDCLSPRELEEIETQKEFLLTKPEEDLNSYIDGKIGIENFLLKLSPEQERVKNLQNDNAILVQGGPGTGKSIVAIYRVKKLVDDHIPKILFTTYTESLARYSSQLLKSLLGKPPEECGVEVTTVDQLMIKYYQTQYDTPYFPQDEGLIFLQSARQRLSDGEKRSIRNLEIQFLLEEIKVTIEACGIDTLEKYLQENEYIKKFPLSKEQYKTIWKLYGEWKQIGKDSGFISKGLMQQKALEIVQQYSEKPYNAIIVDETQDISPVALGFLAQLVVSKSGLYLTADTSQSLYQNGFSWNYIQHIIKFQGSVETLSKSYRTTSEITRACAKIFHNYPNANHLETTISSGIRGDKPTILFTDDLSIRVNKIKAFFLESSKSYKLSRYAGAILTPDPDLGRITAHHLTQQGIHALFMENKEIDTTKNCIKVISIRASKGLEFPFVVVIGLDNDKLPNIINVPIQEREKVIIKELKLFYVGCSRAMRSLLVCASKESPSEFVSSISQNSNWKVERI
jgi:superfamily I DNA/RNA helicase/mRNA-degrading endonuclease RelE of RelBE toxin-antitoxin system